MVDVNNLFSRDVIGMFYDRLDQSTGVAWVNDVAQLINSDQGSENYAWLSQVPAMREWIGGRNAKGFTGNGITVANKHFEATISVPVKWMRRDKTGQVQVRINELSDRAQAHWATLLSTLLINGESTACYDGQYFFDDDHSEGDSGTQSNDLSITLAGLPVSNHGSTTAPSVGEMRECILRAVQAIIGFKDEQGEPMNENAMKFVVMCPTTLMNTAQAAISLPMVDSGESNVIPQNPFFQIMVAPNARLNASWTSKFAVINTDAGTSALIRQQETEVDLKVQAEGSQWEFEHDEHLYGVDTWRNAAYGRWQRACLVTMA